MRQSLITRPVAPHSRPPSRSLGYVLHRDGMQISVTSFKGEAKAYAVALHEVLLEMKAAVDQYPVPSANL